MGAQCCAKSPETLEVDIRKSDGVRCVGGRAGSVLRQDWVHTDRYGHDHLHCCVTPAPPLPALGRQRCLMT